MFKNVLFYGVSALALSAALPATGRAQTPENLPEIEVVAPSVRPGSEAEAVQTPPIVQKFQLPQTSASVTAQKAAEQINAVDTEDAVKYLPSIFVRKRNSGDTQPVLATRTWGVNSSARSLVYVDDMLISALIANNNTIGAPRWGLVAPEAISRIDVLYGPFAAAYPGNSMGAVMQITTKMPDGPVASVKQTEAFQTFHTYGIDKTFPTSQTSLVAGNRIESLSWLLTANYANSYSQPLSWITITQAQTNALASAGVTGVIPARNKTGAVANVVGAGGLLHTQMVNANLKTTYDITSWLKATYALGFWSNTGDSSTQTFLRTAAGAPTFGALTGSNAINGFASNTYSVKAQHLTNAASLKTETGGAWDWEVSVNRYDMLQDQQASPYGLLSGTNQFSSFGKLASYDGTNWVNADARAIWRPTGPGGPHEVSFGVHADRYQLRNPTYQLAQWDSGASSSGTFYSLGRGQTATSALWLQDAWRFAPGFKLTTGLRAENWTASDGYNYATIANANTGAITSGAGIEQPGLTATHLSPKLSLSYELTSDWSVTGSFGNAARFPTVGELYQTVTSGTNVINPNPRLRPEIVNSSELALERNLDGGKLRVSFFHESVRDALISQTSTIAGTTNTATFVDNVARIRNQGVEVAAQKDDVLIDGLQVAGSVTYVDSCIVSDPTWTGATTVVGKKVPYVPDWRFTLAGTYRPDDRWAFTIAGRYSGKMYSTLDNTDTVSHVFGAFDRFLVVDTRAQYKYGDHATFSVGVDNIANTKYDLYHPFPGRTYILDAKFTF